MTDRQHRRYHPLVLETAAERWTDEGGNVHPVCSCCYGCSGLTDDPELWTCADGLGCCDRRVVEQRVCSCSCHAAYVMSVRLERNRETTDVVVAAKSVEDGVLSPGCEYHSALLLLHDLMDQGWQVAKRDDGWCGPIEWDNFRDVSIDMDSGKPCCRCHLGYERVDKIINREWESRT